MSYSRKYAVFVALFFGIFASGTLHPSQGDILVGAFPKRQLDYAGTKLILDNFRLFTSYLETKIGRKIELRAVENIGELKGMLDRKEIDFTWAWTPTESILLRASYPLRPFISIDPVGSEGTSKGFRYILVTQSGNGATTLNSLKGKKFYAIKSEDGKYKNLSYLFVDLLLKKQGIDIRKFFVIPEESPEDSLKTTVTLEFGRSKDLILRVLNDPNVAVSVNEEAYLLLARRNPRVKEMVRIIAATDPIPLAPFFVWQDVDQKMISEIVKAMTEMHKNPEGEEILRSVNIGRWVGVNDASYSALSGLISEARRYEVDVGL